MQRSVVGFLCIRRLSMTFLKLFKSRIHLWRGTVPIERIALLPEGVIGSTDQQENNVLCRFELFYFNCEEEKHLHRTPMNLGNHWQLHRETVSPNDLSVY
jgi:hypothetical protein